MKKTRLFTWINDEALLEFAPNSIKSAKASISSFLERIDAPQAFSIEAVNGRRNPLSSPMFAKWPTYGRVIPRPQTDISKEAPPNSGGA